MRLGTNVLINVIQRVEVGRSRHNDIEYGDLVTHENLSALMAENATSSIDKLPGEAATVTEGITLHLSPPVGVPYTARIQVDGRTYAQSKPSETWTPPTGMSRMTSKEVVYLEAHDGV